MTDPVAECIRSHRQDLYPLLRRYLALQKPFLMRSDLLDAFQAMVEESGKPDLSRSQLGRLIHSSQEAAVAAPWIVMALRPRVAVWRYFRVHVDILEVEELSVSQYLKFKERLISGLDPDEDWSLEIDLAPFNREFPKLAEPRSIGRGVEFLNRHLASRLFVERGTLAKKLLDFLQVHEHQNVQLMMNQRVDDVAELRSAIRQALDLLAARSGDDPWSEVANELQTLGFEPGWGDTVRRIKENFHLLSDLLEAPDAGTLERFLGRVPMIFKIAVLSPHGYFGQDNVLGLPDTGGQVVYILNQVRALEEEMRRRLAEQGLDIEPRILVVTRLIPDSQGTSCDQRLEHIVGTRGVRILRVPFRGPAGNVIPHWISRFEVWPYLERFARDAEREILAELGGCPDLIVGNYSDGNLVASLLSQRLQVTQCNIAHALEKSKYLLSDLYWQELEAQYHFSCQFTADLISMSTADFIIASTYQEIAGTESTIGQYESYTSFTMPGLYRVPHGIDPYDPKFNIVSPGADPEVFFPYTDDARRLRGLHDEIAELVYGEFDPARSRGRLEDRRKPLLFSMARLDRIKNIAGLVDWYGGSTRLRNACDLLLVAGHVDVSRSRDAEEQDQIRRVHELIERHGLDGQVRWLGVTLEKNFSGELYRFVADRGGAFVQPALFEAFGLTVIEAMVSGLPTFATWYGGPLEIIEDGVSGFHIDPNHGDRAAERIAEFFEAARDDPASWKRISENGVARVLGRYTWALYAERMMTLSRIYGFWKYVTNLERSETRRYLEMLYSLLLRPRAAMLDSQGG